MRRLIVLSMMIFSGLTGTANAVPLTANYIFGDSLSDTGNLLALTSQLHSANAAIPVLPGAPYYNGRFTDGLNYAERLAATLGVSAVPSLKGGTNYAYGGARTSYHTTAALSPYASFDAQIASYLGTHPVADPAALYTVYIGSNDVFDIISVAASGQSGKAAQMFSDAIGSITNGLAALAAHGASQFLIPTVPNLGQTPAITSQSSAALNALATQLAVQFNTAVTHSIALISAQDPGIKVWRSDLFALLDDVVANPSDYGFGNAISPCYTGFVDAPAGTVCSKPEDYVFWDRIHPTAAAHEIMADFIAAEIPEPRSLALVLTAFAVLWARWRRAGQKRGTLRGSCMPEVKCLAQTNAG